MCVCVRMNGAKTQAERESHPDRAAARTSLTRIQEEHLSNLRETKSEDRRWGGSDGDRLTEGGRDKEQHIKTKRNKKGEKEEVLFHSRHSNHRLNTAIVATTVCRAITTRTLFSC